MDHRSSDFSHQLQEISRDEREHPSPFANTGILRCNYCSFLAHSLFSLRAHYNTCHENNSGVFACPECPLTFRTRRMLGIHKRVDHDKNPYQCKKCGKIYRSPGALGFHLNAKHGQHKGLQCPVCGQTFAHRQHMAYHMNKKHT